MLRICSRGSCSTLKLVSCSGKSYLKKLVIQNISVSDPAVWHLIWRACTSTAMSTMNSDGELLDADHRNACSTKKNIIHFINGLAMKPVSTLSCIRCLYCFRGACTLGNNTNFLGLPQINILQEGISCIKSNLCPESQPCASRNSSPSWGWLLAPRLQVK